MESSESDESQKSLVEVEVEVDVNVKINEKLKSLLVACRKFADNNKSVKMIQNIC